MRSFSLRIIVGMVMAAAVAVGPGSAAPARGGKAAASVASTWAAPASAKDDCRQDDSCDDTDSNGDHGTDSPCKSDGRPHKAGEGPDCDGDGSGDDNRGDNGDGRDEGCDTDHDGESRGLIGSLACALRGNSG